VTGVAHDLGDLGLSGRSVVKWVLKKVHWLQGIRDKFPGDPCIHYCNGYFAVYLLFK